MSGSVKTRCILALAMVILMFARDSFACIVSSNQYFAFVLFPSDDYPEVDTDGYVTVEVEVGVPVDLAAVYPRLFAERFSARPAVRTGEIRAFPLTVRKVIGGSIGERVLMFVDDGPHTSCEAYRPPEAGAIGVVIGRLKPMDGGVTEIVAERGRREFVAGGPVQVAPTSVCRLPPPVSEQSSVVALYVGKPQRYSPVSLDDRVTKSVILRIEDGDPPLYLVLASDDPVVWKFDGAVGRVRNVVLSRLHGQAAGVVGLDEGLVSYSSCLPAMQFIRSQGDLRKLVRSQLGRRIERYGYVDQSAVVAIPSAKVVSDVGEVPDRLAEFEASDVVGWTRKKDLSFPFGRFGLELLAAEGKLTRIEDVSDSARRSGMNVYRVVAPLDRMPAAVRDHLIVRERFPLPTSDDEMSDYYGRGCRYDETTGRRRADSDPPGAGCVDEMSELLR